MNKTIYDFEVKSKLEKGKTVYMVDMSRNTIHVVNEICAETYVKLMNEGNSDYIFYTDVEEGDEE